MFKLDKDKVIFDENIRFSFIQKINYYKFIFCGKLIRLFFGKKNIEMNRQRYENHIQRKFNKNGLFIYHYGYYKFPKVELNNKIFRGYFESSKYFNDIRDKLLQEFTPIEEKNRKNQRLYDIIENTESICISIRRGDFLSKEHKDECFVCDNEYFENSINEIRKYVKNPRFIVFSDDVNWCRNNMNLPDGTEYEDGTDSVSEKLRLMYSCKHFIISNSSFSWWAQYLSRNEDKIVIAPKKWRNNDYGMELYDDNWILVE